VHDIHDLCLKNGKKNKPDQQDQATQMLGRLDHSIL
jgi:hypothetical protein